MVRERKKRLGRERGIERVRLRLNSWALKPNGRAESSDTNLFFSEEKSQLVVETDRMKRYIQNI